MKRFSGRSDGAVLMVEFVLVIEFSLDELVRVALVEFTILKNVL